MCTFGWKWPILAPEPERIAWIARGVVTKRMSSAATAVVREGMSEVADQTLGRALLTVVLLSAFCLASTMTRTGVIVIVVGFAVLTCE